MDKINSKYITTTFVLFSLLIGFTSSALLRALSGAFATMAKLNNYDLFKHGLPVLLGVAVFVSLQFNKEVLNWADQVIAEIKKIVWLPVKDARLMTFVVIVMVFISTILISLFDLVSTRLLSLFI